MDPGLEHLLTQFFAIRLNELVQFRTISPRELRDQVLDKLQNVLNVLTTMWNYL